jgi:hypothetical protein
MILFTSEKSHGQSNEHDGETGSVLNVKGWQDSIVLGETLLLNCEIINTC